VVILLFFLSQSPVITTTTPSGPAIPPPPPPPPASGGGPPPPPPLPVAVEESNTSPPGMIPVNQHPDYAPYFKMVRVGVPEMVVRGKMAMLGLVPSVFDEPQRLVPAPPSAEEGGKGGE